MFHKTLGWSGSVYLITDKPHCFNEKEIIANANMDVDRMYVVTVDALFDRSHTSDQRQESKRNSKIKTRIFELIPDPSITILAFSDCDVLFGREECPMDLIKSALTWSATDKVGLRVTSLNKNQTSGICASRRNIYDCT